MPPTIIAATNTIDSVDSVDSAVSAGPGAVAGDAPADAEDRRSGDQRKIDVFLLRQVEGFGEEGLFPLQNEPECNPGHDNGAAHHEHQARVPVAGDVEKAEHLLRIRHAGDPQADAEQESGAERRGERLTTPPRAGGA